MNLWPADSYGQAYVCVFVYLSVSAAQTNINKPLAICQIIKLAFGNNWQLPSPQRGFGCLKFDKTPVRQICQQKNTAAKLCLCAFIKKFVVNRNKIYKLRGAFKK